MSEPKLISPLLDGFSMGNPISNHDGVCCCPALKEKSEKRYIVKIISIPASQVQLDALLLTGAYPEPSAALDYFRELSEGVEKEAACLKNLSRLDGFLAYEGWQVVPMDQGQLGYQVYLLTTFKRSLETYMRRNNMTHLGAVNLGIDICDALSAARRAGWIYADLKPSNIFISETNDYRIGDLGLLELDGLELASLPGKYRSAYTAPELADDLVSPNTTLDTYALGKILYQIYNNGQLPQVKHPTEDLPAPPENADYEIAEIILKAIAPDPANRYADPAEMGQALVAYMQRNTVHDSPILPPVADIGSSASEAVNTKATADETLPGMNDEQELPREQLSAEMAQMIAQADDLISHEPPAPAVSPDAASVDEIEEEVFRAAQSAAEESHSVTADNAPEVLPESPGEQATAPKTTSQRKEDVDLGRIRKRAHRKKILISLAIGMILALLAGGGFWFYRNCYVLMVDSLSVNGTEDQMTVILDTQIDNSLLQVVCTDTYGNTTTVPVENGQAVFDALLPDMLYKIRVEVSGFHRLDGSTTHEYMTPAQSRVASFTAATGPEDGSVILNFTVDGPDSDQWTVIGTSEDEEPIVHTFTGHTATISGLTVGKQYSFRLEPVSQLYLTGDASLEFTAARIIIAENLTLTATAESTIEVSWTLPQDAQVESWDVHCYSTDGYDQRLTTGELNAVFTGISEGSAYTVEVTAAGMTQPARATITANPIYVSNIQVNFDDPMNLTVTWDFTGDAPEGGWLLLYTIDGSARQQVVQCEGNSGVIGVRVPAATYDLTIQAADGRTVFDGVSSFKVPNAEIYENAPQAFYPRVQAEYFFVHLLKTPEVENWTHSNVSQANYTTTFASGEPISVFLYYMKNFYIRHENITVMYVIRDESGKVLTDHIGLENLDWRDDMWRGQNYHYCGLDVPSVPTEAGTYTLGVYFNGYAVTNVEFTITE